jgi:hypothetical protein
VTRSVKRPYKLPVVVNKEEIEQVKEDARRADLTLSAYVRKRLRLPEPTVGRPKGSPNRKKDGE